MLPHGWRFEAAQTRSCPHCGGSGEVETHGLMISPTGHHERVIGFTRADAKLYAELWAPERCSPEKRRQLYGT